MMAGIVDFWGPRGGCGGAMPRRKTCVLLLVSEIGVSMHREETVAKVVNNGCNSIVGINEIS